ncbi:MAG: TetR/AcrR family transcriptional regulator [Alcanivoracaceae bacterium]|nr:TetR/AcrR family transcriptional regulator [Alcanivoracaceae bacterium]
MSKIDHSGQPLRVYGGETASQRKARQRRQFLQAGLQVFGSEGYRHSTVKQLCQVAGLTDRYFYRNFKDKEALLAAVYTEAMDGITGAIAEAVQRAGIAKDPHAAINAGLDAFFTAIEDQAVARVCWLEVLGVSADIDTLYNQRVKLFAQLLLMFAQSLKPDAPLNDNQPRIISLALVGAISQTALHWLLDGYRTPRADLVAANSLLINGAMEGFGLTR